MKVKWWNKLMLWLVLPAMLSVASNGDESDAYSIACLHIVGNAYRRLVDSEPLVLNSALVSKDFIYAFTREFSKRLRDAQLDEVWYWQTLARLAHSYQIDLSGKELEEFGRLYVLSALFGTEYQISEPSKREIADDAYGSWLKEAARKLRLLRASLHAPECPQLRALDSLIPGDDYLQWKAVLAFCVLNTGLVDGTGALTVFEVAERMNWVFRKRGYDEMLLPTQVALLHRAIKLTQRDYRRDDRWTPHQLFAYVVRVQILEYGKEVLSGKSSLSSIQKYFEDVRSYFPFAESNLMAYEKKEEIRGDRTKRNLYDKLLTFYDLLRSLGSRQHRAALFHFIDENRSVLAGSRADVSILFRFKPPGSQHPYVADFFLYAPEEDSYDIIFIVSNRVDIESLKKAFTKTLSAARSFIKKSDPKINLGVIGSREALDRLTGFTVDNSFVRHWELTERDSEAAEAAERFIAASEMKSPGYNRSQKKELPQARNGTDFDAIYGGRIGELVTNWERFTLRRLYGEGWRVIYMGKEVTEGLNLTSLVGSPDFLTRHQTSKRLCLTETKGDPKIDVLTFERGLLQLGSGLKSIGSRAPSEGENVDIEFAVRVNGLEGLSNLYRLFPGPPKSNRYGVEVDGPKGWSPLVIDGVPVRLMFIMKR
jgi:hypothetical protein